MSKWEQYRVTDNDHPVSKWDSYRVDYAADEDEDQPKGDSWPALLGKSALKGVTSIADLPRLAEEISAMPRNAVADFFNVPSFRYEPMLPTTADAREKINEYTGIDLEPRPSGPAQRIASMAPEWAAPGGMFGAFAKAGKLSNATKQASLGAGIGTASAVMQEVGVNPLLADAAASLTPYGLSKTTKSVGKLGGKLVPSPEESASKILKDKVGKGNLPKVIENLDMALPFNAPANSAELAQNTGMSSLHRAMSPNIPAIAEKQATADMLLKKRIENISSSTGQPSYSSGQVIREGLDRNLDNAIKIRAQETEPLYAALYDLDTQVKLPKTKAFLQKEGKFAKGDIKKSLNYIDSLITSNKNSSRSGSSYDKALKEYSGLSESAKNKLLEAMDPHAPVPGQIKGALTEITDKYKSAKKAGNDNLARIYKQAKENILLDMAHIPQERIARETYSTLSKPVSAIEKEPLLQRFIKKDEFGKDYIVSPEKIPKMIVGGSTNNIKALMKQAKSNPKMLSSIRGIFIDDLMHKSSLSSINARGERNLSYDKFSKFLKANKGKLELVFDQNQLEVLNDAKELLKRRNMVQTMGRAAGSNTQSEMTLLRELTSPVGKLGKSAAKFIPGGRTISKVAAPVYEALQNTQKLAIKELLASALADPAKAKLLLTKTKDIKSTKQLGNILAKLGPMAESAIPRGSE
jgi:hypothetical protein